MTFPSNVSIYFAVRRVLAVLRRFYSFVSLPKSVSLPLVLSHRAISVGIAFRSSLEVLVGST